MNFSYGFGRAGEPGFFPIQRRSVVIGWVAHLGSTIVDGSGLVLTWLKQAQGQLSQYEKP